MKNKLEEVLGMKIDEEQKEEQSAIPSTKPKIIEGLNTLEKVDYALETVTGLTNDQADLEEIASKALNAFESIMINAENAPPVQSGKIYEAAASMLKVALGARSDKANAKLKTIELQLKRLRAKPVSDDSETPAHLSRADVLKKLKK